MVRTNDEIAALLENIARLLALKGENPFRLRAYTEAALSIRALSEDIVAVQQAGRLEDVPGVGPSIAAKIAEYLSTGHSSYYDGLKRQVPVAAADLLEVPGIGPAHAHVLYQQAGISTVSALEQAARLHRLRSLPGFGAHLEEKIGREAARVLQRTRRMLLGVALPAAEEVVDLLRQSASVQAIHPAGSLRRMQETIGDIDLLVGADHPEAVMAAFTTLPIVAEVLARGPTRASILTRTTLQIDLRAVAPDVYGAALQYFTGSREHNIALRNRVSARGWKLSEYGLFDRAGHRLAARTEEEIYRALGLDPMPPELRENRGELEAAACHCLPDLLQREHIRGDLHVHTTWSDGYDPPERMVEAAIARGYAYLALSDHSPSLGVAHGLSVERVRAQRRLIDQLNERYAPFRVLQGMEVNILPDGRLDYPDTVLAEFDWVTASVHSALEQPREQMTARVLRALRHPYVDCLGHPTGRLLLRRPESAVDLEAVVRTAAEQGVALEVNGQPERLDLSDVWCRRAVEAGARLVCGSDAHAARQLETMRYAVATARRGWVEPQHVLNTRTLAALLCARDEERRQRSRRDTRSRQRGALGAGRDGG